MKYKVKFKLNNNWQEIKSMREKMQVFFTYNL